MTKVKTITKPGIYDIAEADYHADPCPEPSLSKSIAKVMLDQTARHAWMKHPRLNPDHEPENKPIYDLGSAAHKLVLGAGADLVVVEADSWRTKDAKEQRDAIWAEGSTPLLPHQLEECTAMAKACAAQLKFHPEAREAFMNGKPEQMIAWQDENGGWHRCLMDWMPHTPGPLYDYKTTTSANADDFTRRVFDLGYDLQADYYSEGFQKIMGGSNREFRFIVQENKPPFALNVIQLQPSALEVAHARMARAKKYWAWCLAENMWPGYPSKVSHISAPIWYQMQHEDMALNEKLAVEAGDSMKDYMLEWQAPHEGEK
jgi:hypothetical protein